MHRVGSAGNNANSNRPRKEKRLRYVLSDTDDTKVKFFRFIYLFIYILSLVTPLSFIIEVNKFSSFIMYSAVIRNLHIWGSIKILIYLSAFSG